MVKNLENRITQFVNGPQWARAPLSLGPGKGKSMLQPPRYLVNMGPNNLRSKKAYFLGPLMLKNLTPSLRKISVKQHSKLNHNDYISFTNECIAFCKTFLERITLASV